MSLSNFRCIFRPCRKVLGQSIWRQNNEGLENIWLEPRDRSGCAFSRIWSYHPCMYLSVIYCDKLSKQLFSYEISKGWISWRPILLMKIHGSQIVSFATFFGLRICRPLLEIFIQAHVKSGSFLVHFWTFQTQKKHLKTYASYCMKAIKFE